MMRHLRAIVRASALAGLTLVMYAVLVFGLLLVLAFKGAAHRWRGLVFRHWAKWTATILGIKVLPRGTPPETPFLLVANHLSYVDVVVLASQLDCVFVARSDVARWPLIGSLCRSVGTLFIDRENRGDIARVNARIDQAQREGRGVVLFAEGTSTRGDTVLPFKSSLLERAARANGPVSYAAITYRTRAGEAPADISVCWWGDMTFMKHLFDLLYLTEIQATVVFGAEPIRAANRKVLATRLWRAVSEQFIPLTESSESNLQLASVEARKLKLER